MPEARVEQVQHGVLHAADVEVDATGVALELRPHPVPLHLRVDEGVLVGGVQVAQLVPARPGPVGHRAELAAVGLRPLAQVEHHLDPVVGAAQRRLGLRRGVVDVERARRVVVDLRQQHRQLVVGYGDGEVVLVEHDRERLAPVALPREQPVVQLVGHGLVAGATVGQPGRDGALGAIDGEVVQRDLVVGAVDGRSLTDVGLALPALRRLDGADDRQSERLREVPVALVLAGHGHDGPGAVAHQHVVGDEHRQRLAVRRVGGSGTQEHAGLVAIRGLAIELALAGGRGAVGLDGFLRRRGTAGPSRVGALGPGVGQEVVDHRVLRGQHHVGGSEERVGPRGEDRDRSDLGGEPHLGALAAADPVPLHQLDGLGPVEPVEIVEQPVGVGGDPHHPLLHRATEHREVAPLRSPVGRDLLVGQHGAEPRAPVHRHLFQVGQAMGVDHLAARKRIEVGPRRPGRVRARGRLAGRRVELGLQLGDRPRPVLVRRRTRSRRSAGRSTASTGRTRGPWWTPPDGGRGPGRCGAAAWR